MPIRIDMPHNLTSRKSPSAMTFCDFQWLGKCFILSYTIKKTKAVTLLEMLIAIAIFALVATSISLIFNRSLFVYRASTNKNNAVQEAQIAMEWLVRDIESAYSIAIAKDSDITLMGSQQRYIRYYLDTDQAIKRQECSTPGYLLAEGVTQFSLKYYDINNNVINDPVTNILSLKTVEIDVTVRKKNQEFRLNTLAGFELNLDYSWAKAYGVLNTVNERLFCLRQTVDGYVLGGYSQPGTSLEFLLIKTNPSGAVVWAKTYGGSGYDIMNSLSLTSDRGYLLGGETDSFGAGGDDCLLIKTYSDGEIEWAKTYGRSGNDRILSLPEVQDAGGYIFAGEATSFGPSYMGSALVIKTDSAGNINWARTYDAFDYGKDSITYLQQISTGYILGGNTVSLAALPATASDHYLAIKTDANGNVGSIFQETWAKSYGGDDGEDLGSIQQTDDGGYILGGSTDSFFPASLLVIKTDSQGNIGAGANGITWAMTYDILSYSLFQTQLTIDKGYAIAGRLGFDFVLIKTNTTGVVEWAKTYAIPGQEYFTSFQQTLNGYILGGLTDSYGTVYDLVAVKVDALGRLGCCSGIEANATISGTPQNLIPNDITSDIESDLREYPDSNPSIANFPYPPVVQTHGNEFNLSVRRYSNDGNDSNDDFTLDISHICPAIPWSP